MNLKSDKFTIPSLISQLDEIDAISPTLKYLFKTVVQTFAGVEDKVPEVSTYKYDWGAVQEENNLGISARI